MQKEHWEDIHRSRDPEEATWFQEHPSYSLDLIILSEVQRSAPIIDIGAGSSRLAEHLLNSGYTDLTVLDISSYALNQLRQRLDARAEDVSFLEADILTVDLPRSYHLWHDRAVFHFLTEPEERLAYKRRLVAHLQKRGFFIVATFDENGPLKCSGLPVVRYSLDDLQEEFQEHFDLIGFLREAHRTPAGRTQNFVFTLFQRR